jgi:hypothetical protein
MPDPLRALQSIPHHLLLLKVKSSQEREVPHLLRVLECVICSYVEQPLRLFLCQLDYVCHLHIRTHDSGGRARVLEEHRPPVHVYDDLQSPADNFQIAIA